MQFSSVGKHSRIATSLAVALFVASPVAAAQDVVFDGSKVRVNLSNKLTMLTQRISAAGCQVQAGIDVDAAQADLEAARRDFTTILSGLENGDPVLGIPTGENAASILRSIEAVQAAWAPIDTATQMMLANENIPAASETISTSSAALGEATGILASDILGRYSNPHEMTQSDALALNFAGRQRMLTYQISSSLCGIKTGIEGYGTLEAFSEYMRLYEASLGALREGMAAVGINPPPNEVIERELAAVSEDWATIKPALASTAQSGQVDEAEIVAFSGIAGDISKDMSNVVTLYMLAAPESEDVWLVALESYARAELAKWLDQPALIEAVKAQNIDHESLTQTDIDNLDLDWRAQAKAGGGELIERLLSGNASAWLKERQDATAGFVTEVFAMDNKGLNVAQSVETSDYWQGDEAKWKETYGNGSGATHISEVELDASTGAYQTQVSMPLHDPDTGELIGAITFGINIQSLL